MEPETSTSYRRERAVSFSRRSCWAVSVLILLLRPAAAIRERELAARRAGGLSSRSVEEVERRWQDLPEAAVGQHARGIGEVDIVAESIRLDGVGRWHLEGGGTVSETREQAASAMRRLFAPLAPVSCPDTATANQACGAVPPDQQTTIRNNLIGSCSSLVPGASGSSGCCSLLNTLSPAEYQQYVSCMCGSTIPGLSSFITTPGTVLQQCSTQSPTVAPSPPINALGNSVGADTKAGALLGTGSTPAALTSTPPSPAATNPPATDLTATSPSPPTQAATTNIANPTPQQTSSATEEAPPARPVALQDPPPATLSVSPPPEVATASSNTATAAAGAGGGGGD